MAGEDEALMTPCDHQGAVDYNPLNGVMQCHRCGEVINPTLVFDTRDYGAQADGVTDDTEALRAAIQAAQRAGGGVIQLHEGSVIDFGKNQQQEGERDG